jgi:hypothetical protein
MTGQTSDPIYDFLVQQCLGSVTFWYGGTEPDPESTHYSLANRMTRKRKFILLIFVLLITVPTAGSTVHLHQYLKVTVL